ncbi:MAG: hypothetical protein MJ245_05775 [Clostridia bacterium]|nr:hypothetical protein [Clostridia bacterium]
MRGLIYDVITGCAIIIGLFVITQVMRANQNFIMNSATTKSDEERLIEVEVSDRTKEKYNVLDAYGTFHTLLKDGNITDDQDRWRVYDYTIIDYWGSSHYLVDDTYTNQNAIIKNIETDLLNFVNTQPNREFVITRENGGMRDEHKVIKYKIKIS